MENLVSTDQEKGTTILREALQLYSRGSLRVRIVYMLVYEYLAIQSQQHRCLIVPAMGWVESQLIMNADGHIVTDKTE